MIHGDRVRQVRELHRMTQADLVSEVHGLTQPKLSRIEKGLLEPDAETVAMIAASSGVTPGFFNRESTSSIQALSPQFRARNRLNQVDKNAAQRWAELILEAYEQLALGSSPIRQALQRMENADPAHMAMEFRKILGFDSTSPLPYLLLAVERLGVSVVGLPIQLPTMDAFSAWNANTPIIAVLSGTPGDRLRFSVAHELGHLVLHDRLERRPELEMEADAFASELLLPRDIAFQVIPSTATLSTLVMLKGRWGVSVKSLVYRARSLKLMPEERCISLYKQISARGWNKSEPGFVPSEKPRAFRKLAEMRYGFGPNIERMALDLNWSQGLLQQVLDQHSAASELPFEGPLPDRQTYDNVVKLDSARRFGT